MGLKIGSIENIPRKTKIVVTLQVCYGFYKKFSKEDEIEAARTETILRIAQYVKTHPHARPHELRAKVDDEINLFRVKLQSIQ